jgi:F-type H+-transporting ATPase subunit delta
MKSDALSMVYARSLFELAESAGGPQQVQQAAAELEQIAELARGDRAFREFLTSPLIDKSRRAASLERIFRGRVSDLMLRFLQVLNQKRRLGRFESVAEAMDHLMHEAFGRVEIDLFTAARLGAAQREQITLRIREALGREPVVHAYIEPAMIGGVKLRVGDQLIDGSIASRLKAIQTSLVNSSAALRDRMDRFVTD